MKWRNWVNVMIGLWFITSPWALGLSHQFYATWGSVIGGAVLLIVSAPAASSADARWSLWGIGLSMVCGFWFLIEPFLGHYEVGQYWSVAIPAIVTIALDCWTWIAEPESVRADIRTRTRS